MTETLTEIVLLPGLDGTGMLFERLQQQLPADAVCVTVVAYPADPSMTYRDYAALVTAIVGSRRVVLLGESFSGPVAVMVAAAMPDQVRGLMLSATFLQSPWPGWLVRLASRFNPIAAPNSLRDIVLMGRRRDAELSSQISAIVAGMPAGIRASRMIEVSRIDVRAEFSRLTCPILALHDAADWIVPKRQLEVAIRNKRDARVVIIYGAHMVLQTQPRLAAQHILKFVRTLNRPDVQ